MGWCLDSPCGESFMGSLVWHLSLCSQSQYQWGGILPVDVCVDVVHCLSLRGENQECVPACCINLRYKFHEFIICIGGGWVFICMVLSSSLQDHYCLVETPPAIKV